MENNRLTDEQVLALDRVLVEGNKKIVALHFEGGYYGRGGSNSSPYTQTSNGSRTLEQIAGQRPLSLFNVYVRAVVNDVVYLTYTDGSQGEVISFDENGQYTDSYGIAYDTYEGCLICPIKKSEE